MATTIGLAVSPSLYKNLPHNPTSDFKLVAPVAKIPNVLVVNSQWPVSNLDELAAYMRTH